MARGTKGCSKLFVSEGADESSVVLCSFRKLPKTTVHIFVLLEDDHQSSIMMFCITLDT